MFTIYSLSESSKVYTLYFPLIAMLVLSCDFILFVVFRLCQATKPLIFCWSWTGICSLKTCGDCLQTITLLQDVMLLTDFIWLTATLLSSSGVFGFCPTN